MPSLLVGMSVPASRFSRFNTVLIFCLYVGAALPHFGARTRLRFSFSLLHHTVIDTLSVLQFIVSFQDDQHDRQFILQLTFSRFSVVS